MGAGGFDSEVETGFQLGVASDLTPVIQKPSFLFFFDG